MDKRKSCFTCKECQVKSKLHPIAAKYNATSKGYCMICMDWGDNDLLPYSYKRIENAIIKHAGKV